MTHSPMECPDCGAELASQEEFDARSAMIFDALVDIVDPTLELALLAEAAGRFLAVVPAEQRKRIRRLLFSVIDEKTRECVIAYCDA
jgi:hypothetical protein